MTKAFVFQNGDTFFLDRQAIKWIKLPIYAIVKGIILPKDTKVQVVGNEPQVGDIVSLVDGTMFAIKEMEVATHGED